MKLAEEEAIKHRVRIEWEERKRLIAVDKTD